MYFYDSDLGIKDTIAKNEDDVPSRAQSGRGALIEKFVRNMIKKRTIVLLLVFFVRVIFYVFFKLLIQSPIRQE